MIIYDYNDNKIKLWYTLQSITLKVYYTITWYKKI